MAYSEEEINPWERITTGTISFGVTSSQLGDSRDKKKNISNFVKPLSGMCTGEDRHTPAKARWALGYISVHMFSCCVKMYVIYSVYRLSHFIFIFIASSNAMHFCSLFPLENIAWQQEEAPSGGPFMSEAIISEWISPTSSKAQTFDFWEDWISTVHDTVATVQITLLPYLLTPCSVSLSDWLNICLLFFNNPRLLTLFVTLSPLLSLSFCLSI